MARFTDEKKWSDKWFRSLSSNEKLVWLFLIDNCDIAGFYELDYGYIAFHTGLNEADVTGAIQGLSRGYLEAGGFIWIKNFLKHQKNHILNPDNNCHKGIIKRIEDKLLLFPDIPDELGAKEPLFRGIGKGKGKGKGKSKGKEKDKNIYSDCVSLSSDEFDKLIKKYGNVNNLNKGIDILNNYKQSSGKKYKSDYHCMIGWVYREYLKQEIEGGNKADLRNRPSNYMNNTAEDYGDEF